MGQPKNPPPILNLEFRVKEALLEVEELKFQIRNGYHEMNAKNYCALVDKLSEALQTLDLVIDRLMFEVGIVDVDGHCILIKNNEVDIIPINNDEH
jgi:hypothetical protein